MDKNEFYTYEDRAYIDPTLSSGEQEKFIDNFRDIQKRGNAQIAEQTYNLGTEVPSNLGGLGGGEGYFASRYQTPQVTEMANTLQSAAQAQALNDVMSNYQNQLQNKYKQAYRKYQARERARQRALQNAALKSSQPTKVTKGKVDEVVELPSHIGDSFISGKKIDSTTPSGKYTTSVVDMNNKYWITRDEHNNIVNTNAPGYVKGDDGYYYPRGKTPSTKNLENYYNTQSQINNSFGGLF